jgi:hypothetical protein
MWISKKKYNALLEQKKDLERIAANAVEQNGRLLDDWGAAIEEMKSIQKLNHNLQQSNEVLLAYTKELEAKLDFAIKQRDYYYDLLENTEGVHVGDVVVKEAE